MKTFLPEWTPQWGTALVWPHAQSDWLDILEQAERCYIDLVAAICQFQQALILVQSTTHQQQVSQLLIQANVDLHRCHFVVCETNDTWIRDFGPLTIKENNELVLLDYGFNGWGNKFTADKDNAVNSTLLEQGVLSSPMHSYDFVLEGGSIDTNGRGVMLTTSECLLSKERNPTYSRERIEKLIKDDFGIEALLWLDHGSLQGDDTDGHIDTLVRFADEKTILYTECDDEYDAHYAILQAMKQQLHELVRERQLDLRLISLPLPSAIYDELDGHRLPATYANFLFVNDGVLVPIYNAPEDEKALNIIAEFCPNHKIVPVNCQALIRQHGSLHCATMQLPIGTVNLDEHMD